MDIASRLRELEARKRASSQLVEDVRAGLYPFVGLAESLPDVPAPRQPEEPPSLEGFVVAAGRDGAVLHRSITIGFEGSVRVPFAPGSARSFPAEGLRMLLGAEPCAPTEIAFLDTETSGLAGGAGTVAFLIGVAYFRDDGQMELEQFLLRDFCDEAEQIRRVAELLSRFRVICHYNGRTFDMPILRTRAIMNRQRPASFKLPELDLLPHSRRLWRGHLESVSLKNVERGILALDRGADIGGAEIPPIFHDFARGGGESLMARVAKHNAQDIASLGGLLALHAEYLAEPDSPRIARVCELEGLARLFGARGDTPRACSLLERAMLSASTAHESERLALRLAPLRCRMGDHAAAANIWREMLGGSIHTAHVAAISLAKHFEHRMRDSAEALATTRRWLRQLELQAELEDMLQRQGAATDLLAREREPIMRRIARLEKRLSKKPAPPPK